MGDCWIETYTGRRFHPLRPDPAEIFIEDIAHALANQCRFSGHVKKFYSVAQHSVLVSEVCADPLAGLLHDATEAYLIDLPRPIKHQSALGKIFSEIEDRIMDAVAERFSLVLPLHPSVKIADTALLLAEKRDLMPLGNWDVYPEKWGMEQCAKAAEIKIDPLLPSEAKALFLARFAELTAVST